MFKIWAKTVRGEKLTRNYLYYGEGEYTDGRFEECIYDICNELDIPSPVIMRTHVQNFEQFNHTVFRASDYVESIDFDRFTVEYCLDEKRPAKDLRFYP